jgi:hypothetical protein
MPPDIFYQFYDNTSQECYPQYANSVRQPAVEKNQYWISIAMPVNLQFELPQQCKTLIYFGLIV